MTQAQKGQVHQKGQQHPGRGGQFLLLHQGHSQIEARREMAGQTTFSTIARELRKYYVTLLIVDQRPSQIYDEVMSQLGTRVSGWLGDDDDIRAVLSGLAGREALRGMLLLTPPDAMDRKVSDGTAWGRFGLNLRRMGGKEMMEFLRVLPLPVTPLIR